MKLKTAEKLAWPWETAFYIIIPHEGGDSYTVYESLKSFESYEGDTIIPCPSVEEMLDRMPNSVEYRIYKDSIGEYDVTDGHSPSFDSADLSEAIALLCIWLRDNNLLEWRERK